MSAFHPSLQSCLGDRSSCFGSSGKVCSWRVYILVTGASEAHLVSGWGGSIAVVGNEDIDQVDHGRRLMGE